MQDEKERDNVQEIKERIIRIEILLEVNNKDLFNRVKKIEENQSWLIKTVAAAIIVGVMAFYFK